MRTLKSLLSVITAIILVSCENKPDKKAFNESEFKDWARTPSMGWNSWDCYGLTAKEYEIKRMLIIGQNT